MMIAARLLSLLALLGTIVPPLLFFADRASLEQAKLWLLVSTLLWFVTAPPWMDRARSR